jgi:isocitrate lyase
VATLFAIEDQWIAQAGLKLFDETVVDTIHAGVHVDKEGLWTVSDRREGQEQFRI